VNGSIVANANLTKEILKLKLNQKLIKDDLIIAYRSLNNPEKIKGKRILLVDDIFDSGATIKELGKLFTKFGAVKIAPIVIAKTVGGDLA
jgi:ATP-dependent DNA helicase RecQ